MSKRVLISIAAFFIVFTVIVFIIEIAGSETNTSKTVFTLDDSEDFGEFDRITLNYQDYENDSKGPVVFTHKRHVLEYQINCWECHHDYNDDGENIWSPWYETGKCIDCHDPVEKIGAAVKLETAFHLNCISCHRKEGIYAEEFGALKDCGSCHLQQILIENKVYEEDIMGPVLFNHEKHAKGYLDVNGNPILCTDCHHEYVNGENVWTEEDPVKNCATSGCHDPYETKDDKQYKLRTAYHYGCRVCHRDLTKAGISDNAPYVKCTACHSSQHTETDLDAIL
jgi:hypothetical protein